MRHTDNIIHKKWMESSDELPKILVICGTHGNELSAVKMGIRLNKMFKSIENIDIIPFNNKSALKNGTRESFQLINNYDLNRTLFSNENETHSEISEKLKECIKNYDIIIDIHNSPRCGNFFLIDDDSYKYELQQLALYAGVQYIIRSNTSNTIKKYCNQIGKLGFTYEFRGMDTGDNLHNINKAFRDILAFINNIADQQKFKIPEILPEYNLREVVSHSEGFVDFYTNLNQICEKDSIIACIIDEMGEIIQEIKAPYRCKVIIQGHEFAEDGSIILYIIELDEDDHFFDLTT